MSQEDLLQNSTNLNSILYIDVINIEQFNALLKEVEINQEKLNQAVTSLKRFSLEVSFTSNK